MSHLPAWTKWTAIGGMALLSLIQAAPLLGDPMDDVAAAGRNWAPDTPVALLALFCIGYRRIADRPIS